MDLLLINPPYFTPEELAVRRELFGGWIAGGNMYIHPFEPPLGLAALSAYLNGRAFRVEVLDLVGLGIPEDKLPEILREKSPARVGIGAMTPLFPAARRLARVVKQTLPEAAVIAGGAHPTVSPETCLSEENIDFIVRGEGEEALAALLAGVKPDQIPGLGWKSPGGGKINYPAPLAEDLDSLPLPDYDAFPVEKYVKYNESLRGIRGISMLVSRGCPYQCSFCAVHLTMGRKFRIKRPARVVREMAGLQEKYSLEGIWFKDSILNLDLAWAGEFAAEIKRRGVKIKWQYNTRVDRIDEAEILAEKEAGLVQVDFGIESGSPQSLATLRKGIDLEMIKSAVRLAQKHVRVSGFFMIGIPGETREDIEMTFSLAKSLKLDKVCVSLYCPLPGSALYDDLKKREEYAGPLADLAKIHFTENPFSFCAVPAEKLRELYGEINEYFAKSRQ
ncbi:MAG: radical SAM protein [Proteobacteria bacterium]|nr:radical SAM protein [Pseudomonadota bacterium]